MTAIAAVSAVSLPTPVETSLSPGANAWLVNGTVQFASSKTAP